MHNETVRYRAELSADTSPFPASSLVDPEEAFLNGADDEVRRSFRVLTGSFSSFVPLSHPEISLLRDLAETTRYHPPYRDLCAIGALPPLRLVVAGWACRYRQLTNGRRQIIKLVLPGDLIGPVLQQHLPLPYAVAALTELETVSAVPLAKAISDGDAPAYPGLTHAARLKTHHDEALVCNQVVRLGQQSACVRFAHLMLELHERLGRVGLVEADCFVMPLTQPVLADVLGLSVVHVNRTVQRLRRDGLLDVRNGTAVLADLERLRALAGWTAPMLLGS